MSLGLIGKMKGLLFVSIPAHDSGPEALNFYLLCSIDLFFSWMHSAFAVVSKNFVFNPMLQKFSPIFFSKNVIILQLYLPLGRWFIFSYFCVCVCVCMIYVEFFFSYKHPLFQYRLEGLFPLYWIVFSPLSNVSWLYLSIDGLFESSIFMDNILSHTFSLCVSLSKRMHSYCINSTLWMN